MNLMHSELMPSISGRKVTTIDGSILGWTGRCVMIKQILYTTITPHRTTFVPKRLKKIIDFFEGYIIIPVDKLQCIHDDVFHLEVKNLQLFGEISNGLIERMGIKSYFSEYAVQVSFVENTYFNAWQDIDGKDDDCDYHSRDPITPKSPNNTPTFEQDMNELQDSDF